MKTRRQHVKKKNRKKKRIKSCYPPNFVFDKTLRGNEAELNNLLVSRGERLIQMCYMKLSKH